MNLTKSWVCCLQDQILLYQAHHVNFLSKASQADGNQKTLPEPNHPPVWAYPLGRISWVVTLDPTLKGWVGRRPEVLYHIHILFSEYCEHLFQLFRPKEALKNPDKVDFVIILTKWTFQCNYLGGPHTGVAMPCPGPSSKVWPYLSLHSRGSDSRILGTRRLWEAYAVSGRIFTP